MVCAQHQIRSFCFRNGAPLHGQTAAIFLRKTRYVVRIRVSTSQVARADCLERWRIFLCFPLLFFPFWKPPVLKNFYLPLIFVVFLLITHTLGDVIFVWPETSCHTNGNRPQNHDYLSCFNTISLRAVIRRYYMLSETAADSPLNFLKCFRYVHPTVLYSTWFIFTQANELIDRVAKLRVE